ncbi:LysE family translocator [Nonomuraea sp. NPDC049152]|uniref:LysE family translocator n=1 Tax=Nonomuraea sp. NPDC049152 TaxID=3154350 RepID=UPI00340844DB
MPLFVVTTWLLAMLPGAGQALMVRQTLAGGRRGALSAIAGNASGLLIWTTAAAAGLSAVVLADPAAYGVVRVVGGIVLFALGVSTLASARRTVAVAERGGREAGFWRGYGIGLATNLGNPKAGVFAVSVLPQFVSAQGPVFVSSVALGVVWALVNVTWYLLFTWAVDRGRALVSRPVVHRWLQVLTGAVLLVLGVAVAAGD